MEVKRNVTDSQVTLEVSGEIEVYSLPDFTRMAESYVGGSQDLIIDLKDLEYIDSSGLGFLVTLHDRLERNGQHLKLINMPTHVSRVFTITLLDKIFDLSAMDPTTG